MNADKMTTLYQRICVSCRWQPPITVAIVEEWVDVLVSSNISADTANSAWDKMRLGILPDKVIPADLVRAVKSGGRYLHTQSPQQREPSADEIRHMARVFSVAQELLDEKDENKRQFVLEKFKALQNERRRELRSRTSPIDIKRRASGDTE